MFGVKHIQSIDEYISVVTTCLTGKIPADEAALIQAELRQHLDAIVSEEEAEGLQHLEAVRAAVQRFGSPSRLGSQIIRAWRYANKQRSHAFYIGRVAFAAVMLCISGFLFYLGSFQNWHYHVALAAACGICVGVLLAVSAQVIGTWWVEMQVHAFPEKWAERAKSMQKTVVPKALEYARLIQSMDRRTQKRYFRRAIWKDVLSTTIQILLTGAFWVYIYTSNYPAHGDPSSRAFQDSVGPLIVLIALIYTSRMYGRAMRKVESAIESAIEETT